MAASYRSGWPGVVGIGGRRLAVQTSIGQILGSPAFSQTKRNQKPPKNWFNEFDFYLDTSFNNQPLSQGSHHTPTFTIRGGDIWLGGCFTSKTTRDAKTIVPAIWQIQTQNGPGVARVYGTRTVGIPLSGPTEVYWTIVIPPTVKNVVFCSLKKGALIGTAYQGLQAQN